jgi:hypothetical protein
MSYAECHYAECHMLNDVMLDAFMPTVVAPLTKWQVDELSWRQKDELLSPNKSSVRSIERLGARNPY